MNRFQLFLVSLIILLFLVAPALAIAQDDATPLPAPTQELFTNTPAAPTVEPTVEATPIPTPEPAPPVVVVTEPPFSRVDVVYIVVLVALTIILLFAGQLIKGLVRERYDAAPPLARDITRMNAIRLLDAAEKRAEGTPTPIDDELLAYVRKFVLTDLFPEIVVAVQNAPKRPE